jgi:hypothetical protein
MLLQSTQHNHSSHFLEPDHLPEIIHALRDRALRGDEIVFLACIRIGYVVGVNICIAWIFRFSLEAHHGMRDRNDIRVSIMLSGVICSVVVALVLVRASYVLQQLLHMYPTLNSFCVFLFDGFNSSLFESGSIISSDLYCFRYDREGSCVNTPVPFNDQV